MSVYGAQMDASSMQAGPNMNGGARNRPDQRRREGGNRSARTACDFFIFLDVLAAIAFIIAGLCPVTWIGYTTATDSTTTNSSASAMYFSRNRGLFYICPNSAQSAVNSLGCWMLDLAPTPVAPSSDYQYWNIIAMRRTEIAFFIISVVLSGVAVLVHLFCCIPHCRHEAGNGYWKNGIISGVLTAFAAAFQLIGMIVYQADLYYEAVYSGNYCMDCWGYWPVTISNATLITFGPGYALGWCAAGLLVYGSIAYLSREICVVRGCRAPAEETDDDLEVLSGASSTAPYLKGTARDLQFNQVTNAPRLQRYDMATARAQPQSYYPNLYGRTDLVY